MMKWPQVLLPGAAGHWCKLPCSMLGDDVVLLMADATVGDGCFLSLLKLNGHKMKQK